MKKLMAALLVLAMLLSACACAESAQMTLRNVQVYSGEQVLCDLSGFDVELTAGAASAESAGVSLACIANGQELANLVASYLGDKLLGGYGMGGALTGAYYVDAPANDEARAVRQALADGFAGSDFGAAQDTFAARLREGLPAEWTSDGGTVDYAGESCQATLFELPEEGIEGAIRSYAAYVDSVPALGEKLKQQMGMSAAELVSELDLRVRVSGGVYQGASADYLDATLELSLAQQPMQLRMAMQDSLTADGELLSADLSVNADGQAFGATFDLTMGTTAEDAWAQISADGATDLTALLNSGEDASAAAQKLTTDLQAIIASVMSGALGVMATNQLNAAQ